MTVVNLNLVLNSDQFYTGLDEICHRFDGNRSDEHLNALVEEVENAKGMLFQTIKKDMVKKGIKQESFLLRERLASATHYIDSHRFEPDEGMKVSAMALQQQLRRYGVFYKMDVHSRVAEVQAMLSDLDTPEMKAHVAKIPGLEARIKNVKSAMEALLQRLMTVQDLRNEAKPQKSKLELKREAAAKLERLLVYLDGMAFKDPDTYGKDYNYVVGLITDLNKTYKHKVRKAMEDFDEDESDEDLEDEESPENADEQTIDERTTDERTTDERTTDDLPESADSERVA